MPAEQQQARSHGDLMRELNRLLNLIFSDSEKEGENH